MRITIIANDKFKFEGSDGQEVSGVRYLGYPEGSKNPITFTSQDYKKEVFMGLDRFHADRSCEVELNTKLFNDKVKYSEK